MIGIMINFIFENYQAKKENDEKIGELEEKEPEKPVRKVRPRKSR